MKLKAALTAAVAASSLAFASAAEAHTLKKGRAQAIAEGTIRAIIDELYYDSTYDSVGGQTDQCVRRSRHRFDCDMAFRYRVQETGEFYVCTTTAVIRFRNARSTRIRVGITDPQCEQIE